MSWGASVVVGILTAAVGAILGGFVANLAVDWYRVSSFEGGAGYFVVGLALLALIGGLLIGLVTSRVVAGGTDPGFLKALGMSQAVLLGAVAVVGGVARLAADVPPRIDGVELLLAVEVRLPKARAASPAADTAEGRLTLSAFDGSRVRLSETGPLWKEDARLVDGQWVVPGAVRVFTARSQRLLDVVLGEGDTRSFLVPLPGYPGRKHLEWSEWMPRARPGASPLPDDVTYRFRVVPNDIPIRTEVAGPFEIRTIAAGFRSYTYLENLTTYSASARFAIAYRGRPVLLERKGEEGAPLSRDSLANGVAVVAGSPPALVVLGGRECFLVVGDGEGVRTERIAECGETIDPAPLTTDTARFARARRFRPPPGRVDRRTFAEGGSYLFDGAVFDSRSLSVRRFPGEAQRRAVLHLPPLGVSPDGASFARIATDDDGGFALLVVDMTKGESYQLPIDERRMRTSELELLDPVWLSHYFAWERAPGGADRLVERTGVVPLPHRGRLTMDNSGYREYRVAPALESLRTALIDLLVAEFGAERLPAGEGAYAHEVKIGDKVVNVSWREDDRHVGVWMDRGQDTELVATIARRFDEALATRKFDAMFEQ